MQVAPRAASGQLLLVVSAHGWHRDVTQTRGNVIGAVAPGITGCYPVLDAVHLAEPRSPAPS